MDRNEYGFPVLVHPAANSQNVVDRDHDLQRMRGAPGAYGGLGLTLQFGGLWAEPARKKSEAFARAQEIAAGARARKLAEPCDCAECIASRNLPSVQRILARWTPMEKIDFPNFK